MDITERTQDATLIQSRHRIPEHPLSNDQVLVLQVPYPDPLVVVEPSEARRKIMHGEGDYSRLLTKLYEDIVRFDEITISRRYPTRINGHYVLDPSPIPRFDVPKLNQSPALILFRAGREKKIYVVPPCTRAEPLAFDDIAFRTEEFIDARGRRRSCHRCGARDSFLDEFSRDDGVRLYQCSDSDYCNQRIAAQNISAGEPAL